jgi:diacylglycerol kinase (ATP)
MLRPSPVNNMPEAKSRNPTRLATPPRNLLPNLPAGKARNRPSRGNSFPKRRKRNNFASMNERLFQKDRSWAARLWSFTHALRGVKLLLATQANVRVHAVLTLLALILGWWLVLSDLEWVMVIGAIGLVWVAEGFNTAIEFLVDLVSPHIDPRAGLVKDVSAGAVLAASVTALAIGVIIFGPKMMRLW